MHVLNLVAKEQSHKIVNWASVRSECLLYRTFTNVDTYRYYNKADDSISHILVDVFLIIYSLSASCLKTWIEYGLMT